MRTGFGTGRRPRRAAACLVASAAIGTAYGAATAEPAALGPNLERFAYPFEVHWYEAPSQGQTVRMAWMDVAPTGRPKGVTVVLLHGKNFCGATWEENARSLAAHGYRVIAPDQIGFCKSSKPAGYQYSFHALAALTHGMLVQANAGRVILVGHSTGGMVAVRYALDYPGDVARLVLVNPLGLNDPLNEGARYTDLGQLRAQEAKTDAASIRAYQLKVYYHGRWRPAYDRWVDMLAGEYVDDGGVVREAQARTSDMIQTQPVAHEFGRVLAPVSLIIGQRDLTSFGKGAAPPELRDHVLTVPQAAEIAVHRFPHAHLVRLSGLGHSPQVEDPAQFDRVLLAQIGG
ncbi:MAG TPA: alpha/beta hydrolase [Caulobacteraceae bacterium]|jgi:pimeloyl-ACP methyl ester carboxylesterase|nr:alpha/beta hydrolase [Caulobacteraceae bacterium]